MLFLVNSLYKIRVLRIRDVHYDKQIAFKVEGTPHDQYKLPVMSALREIDYAEYPATRRSGWELKQQETGDPKTIICV